MNKIRYETKIAILLCTFNGEKYLLPQLNSIASQTEQRWFLYISDDGSVDRSTIILEQFRNTIGDDRIKIRNGPKKGFSKNFISLLTDPNIVAPYYALCDQDDIWDTQKLEAALKILERIDSKTPALYCGRTIYIDVNNNELGLSTRPVRRLSLKNALVQNIASGNTMILNHAARDMLVRCNFEIDVYAHDWLIYILVNGVGGKIIYDDHPYVRYRQHDLNQIGMNSNILNKLKRLNQFIDGSFSEWNKKNLQFLEKFKVMLANDTQITICNFNQVTRKNGMGALISIYRSGVYRQKWYETLILYVGAYLGKI